MLVSSISNDLQSNIVKTQSLNDDCKDSFGKRLKLQDKCRLQVQEACSSITQTLKFNIFCARNPSC